ncbi:unnamed protein product, partial [marine sediment metagenome]
FMQFMVGLTTLYVYLVVERQKNRITPDLRLLNL